MLTFDFKSEISPVRTTDYKVVLTSFGDGYKQRSNAGINARTETWDLSFPAFPDSKAAQLDIFLDKVGRNTVFLWQSPDRTSLERFVIIKSISRKYLGSDGVTNFSSYTLTFERDYGLFVEEPPVNLLGASTYLNPGQLTTLGANTYLYFNAIPILQTLGITVNPTNITEDSSMPFTYTVTRDTSSEVINPVTVNLTVSGTATFTADYTVSGAATFTSTTATVIIPANSLTKDIIVTPVSDTIFETDETIILAIASNPSVYTINANASATGTILNDDTASTITVAANGITNWIITRTGSTAAALNVNYSIVTTLIGGGVSTVSSSVSIPIGSTTATVPVGALTSSRTENLSITSNAGYINGSPASATITIVEIQVVGITVTPASLNEG
jgi:phage-related protein